MQYYASKFPPLKISPLCQEAFSLLYPRFLDRQWQNYINLRPGPLSPHNLGSAANHFFPQFFWFESTHITWVAESSTRMTPLAAAPAAAPCCGCRRGGGRDRGRGTRSGECGDTEQLLVLRTRERHTLEHHTLQYWDCAECNSQIL